MRIRRSQVLAALPPASRGLVRRLVACANERSVAVHLVGGPVRDLLLCRPIRDVDLLVETQAGGGAPGLAREASAEGIRVVSHKRFGTARVETPGGFVDLATARCESYAHPGALPTVVPGSLEDDLRRRDFTVNALAIPLSRAAARGRSSVIDPGTGLEDLAARRLRIFHPRSFHDDPTRMLRAARLGPRLGFRLDRSGRAALAAAIDDGCLSRVSGDRLGREFEKLFDDARLGLDPVSALRLQAGWGVLNALGGRRLVLTPRSVGELRRLARSLRDPPWVLDGVTPWKVGLALWLAALAAPVRRRVLERLAVRGRDEERILGFALTRMRALRGLSAGRSRGDIDRLLAPLDADTRLAVSIAAPPSTRRRLLRWVREDRDRRSPVTGGDLVALGLRGPAVGQALVRIRAAFLDGAIETRADALDLAKRSAGRAGPRAAV